MWLAEKLDWKGLNSEFSYFHLISVLLYKLNKSNGQFIISSLEAQGKT